MTKKIFSLLSKLPLMAVGFGILAVSLFFLSTSSAYAATKTWSGNDPNASWSDGANWAPSGAPVDGDDVIFDCSLIAECGSVFNIPGLILSSVTFQGTVPGLVANVTDAPVHLTGDITSTNAGSVFHGALILDSNINVNNVVLGKVDLNEHTITITGKGVTGGSCGSGSCIGIGQNLSGNGTLNINVDADQEFYLAGNNTYSGITNVNSGRFISNGQNPTNHSIDMFGVSDVNVGTLGKVVFTFDETETGYSFDNKITFLGGGPTNSQMKIVNQSSNNSLISIGFTDVHLQSDTRFDADTADGNLAINLLGITANNHCMTYGSNNSQASLFINGPDCSEEETPTPPSSVDNVPGTPDSGKYASHIIITIIAAGTITALGAGLYSRRARLR